MWIIIAKESAKVHTHRYTHVAIKALGGARIGEILLAESAAVIEGHDQTNEDTDTPRQSQSSWRSRQCPTDSFHARLTQESTAFRHDSHGWELFYPPSPNKTFPGSILFTQNGNLLTIKTNYYESRVHYIYSTKSPMMLTKYIKSCNKFTWILCPVIFIVPM